MTAEQKKERNRASCRRWRLKNLESERARCRQYNSNNKERLKGYNKGWWKRKLSDPVERAAKLRKNEAYRQVNLPKVNATQKIWRGKNKERRKGWVKSWHVRHKGEPEYEANRLIKWRIDQAKRRALKRKAAINLKGLNAWMKAARKRSNFCYYCAKPVELSELHFDHIIPLSKGGPHAVENLCVSCSACNLSKGSKTVQAWIRVGQILLPL